MYVAAVNDDDYPDGEADCVGYDEGVERGGALGDVGEPGARHAQGMPEEEDAGGERVGEEFVEVNQARCQGVT